MLHEQSRSVYWSMKSDSQRSAKIAARRDSLWSLARRAFKRSARQSKRVPKRVRRWGSLASVATLVVVVGFLTAYEQAPRSYEGPLFGLFAASFALIHGLFAWKQILYYKRIKNSGPYCWRCEYSLQGLTGDHCPECGFDVEKSAKRWKGWQPSSHLRFGSRSRPRKRNRA